jgi:PII-like signaling protein
MAASSLLRIFTDEAAEVNGRPVFEAIVRRASEAGLAGATVIVAKLGFGNRPHLRAANILEDFRSVVVEIVDEEGRLKAFADALAEFPDVGLITLQPVEVLRGGRR